MTRTLVLAALCALAAAPAVAADCLPLGRTATLTGQVYAFEAFDEADGDTAARAREVDYHALVLPARTCIGGDPHVSIVRLEGDAGILAGQVQQKVSATGVVSRSADPDADPPFVMRLERLAPAAAPQAK
ncbi:hypothetical protein [Phenylobacterium zucineum]|uniref:hypothetical protein n=1 Tax=Phenylobacterium zucineum TaxID=284016 RepID=UPI0002D3A3DB|nr:hypothetical protein [Phenylobacterium zucineum]